MWKDEITAGVSLHDWYSLYRSVRAWLQVVPPLLSSSVPSLSPPSERWRESVSHPDLVWLPEIFWKTAEPWAGLRCREDSGFVL